MGTHANWRATVWWSQWQLFTMTIIQFKVTPSRKYRHHFCFYLFAAIVSQFLKEIYLIQDIFINFNGSLFCHRRFLLNQSVIFSLSVALSTRRGDLTGWLSECWYIRICIGEFSGGLEKQIVRKIWQKMPVCRVGRKGYGNSKKLEPWKVMNWSIYGCNIFSNHLFFI